MSSGSSGRYQSRLFNFVNLQSRRLTQQWESTFRYLQVASKWGVEALLYPVYLFLQSADSSVKRLYTKEPSTRQNFLPNNTALASETPLTTDRPIERVLEAIEYLPTEQTTVTPSKTSKLFNPLGFLWSKFVDHRITKPNLTKSLIIPDSSVESIDPSLQQDRLKRHLPTVRGIATDLANRQLVLVSTENQILDILTPQQQAKLTNRIMSEVADFWHDWQLKQAQQRAQLLPEINQILAKLTGENSSKNLVLSDAIPLNPRKIVTLLDGAIAQLEETAILPAKQRCREIMLVAQTQCNIFLYGKEQLNNKGEILIDANSLESQNVNISALIEAAINYFFGVGKFKHLEPQTTHQLTDNNLTDDTWLEWQDLYGDSENINQLITPISTKIKPSIPASKSAEVSFYQKNTLPQPKAKSSLQQKKQQPRKLAKTDRTSNKVVSAKQTKFSVSQQGIYQDQRLETKTDWIEAKATLVGYEKHLLEQVLEWLDRSMLWLEKLIVNIFYFFRGLLGTK